jgi:hypothetical protein
MIKMFSSRKAQNLTEFALVIGLIVIAFMAMEVYCRRGLQAKIKCLADNYMTSHMLGGQNLTAPDNQVAYPMDTHNYVVMQASTPTQSNSTVEVTTSIANGGYVVSNTNAEVNVGSAINPATSQSVATY